jgi:hypothetical protein
MKQVVLDDKSPPHRTTDPVAADPAVISQLPDVALTPIDIAKLDSWPNATRLEASVSVVVVGSVSAMAGLAVITAAISAAPAAAAPIVKIFRRLTAFPSPSAFVMEAAAAGSPRHCHSPFHDLARTHWNSAEAALEQR